MTAKRGEGEGSLQVWNPAAKRRPGFGAPTRFAHGDFFSWDGRRLVTPGPQGVATVWETVTGGKALILPGHDKGVSCVAWSPEGRRLATGSWGGRVRVWDLACGRERLTLRGHHGYVVGVAFTRGNLLVSGSVDFVNPISNFRVGELRAWDCTTGAGRFFRRFSEGEGGLEGLALSPDGSRLATAHNWAVKVWDANQLLGR